ncbi:hypothetical protein MJO29_004523, partial [Puccinia striiformis f. sp. tritici]
GATAYYLFEPVQITSEEIVVPLFFHLEAGQLVAKCVKPELFVTGKDNNSLAINIWRGLSFNLSELADIPVCNFHKAYDKITYHNGQLVSTMCNLRMLSSCFLWWIPIKDLGENRKSVQKQMDSFENAKERDHHHLGNVLRHWACGNIELTMDHCRQEEACECIRCTVSEQYKEAGWNKQFYQNPSVQKNMGYNAQILMERVHHEPQVRSCKVQPDTEVEPPVDSVEFLRGYKLDQIGDINLNQKDKIMAGTFILLLPLGLPESNICGRRTQEPV